MAGNHLNSPAGPKPKWLRTRLSADRSDRVVHHLVQKNALHTVCDEAMCPNRNECFGQGHATFLLLGPSCTRRCTFCAVDKTPVAPLDPDEPRRAAESVASMELDFCVLTMVTRDDLPDGGASHVAKTIREIRRLNPGIGIEVLISDLKGDAAALGTVLDAGPEVLNHNLETIFRLYPEVRPQADYLGSLELINRAHQAGSVTKSGLMLGLGEQEDEVLTALEDLRAAGCDLLTLGQYLAPSRRHHPVVRYVTPEEFQAYEDKAKAMGFKGVASAPLVRSSYRAGELYHKAVG